MMAVILQQRIPPLLDQMRHGFSAQLFLTAGSSCLFDYWFSVAYRHRIADAKNDPFSSGKEEGLLILLPR